MTAGRVYVYVLDTFADWEAGLLMAELRTGRHFSAPGFTPGEGFDVLTVSANGERVTSMGGLKVSPDLAAADVTPEGTDLLILVGGGGWTNPEHRTILGKAADFLSAGVPVAAICGGSEALAGAGLLNNRPHTSNNLDLLKHSFPNYTGEAWYQHVPVCADRDLITATGAVPIEFTCAVLQRLGVMRDDTLGALQDLYTRHGDEDFFRLMRTLPDAH